MDWYVILLLAIVLLIFYMKEFGEHQHVHQYFLPHKELRLSQGVTLMLFHLTSGLLFIAPFVFTYVYGFVGGTVMALTGVILLLFISKQITQFGQRVVQEDNLTSLIKHSCTKSDWVGITALRVIAGSEGLVLNTLFASLILQKLFGVSPVMVGVLMMSFTFIYAGLGGIGGILKVGLWLFALMFAALTLIPVTVYLVTGINSARLELKNIGMLDIHPGPLAVGCGIFVFVFLGRLMLNLLTYPEYSMIRAKRIRTAYQLATFCWSAIPLSSSVILLYFFSLPAMPAIFQNPLRKVLDILPGSLMLPIVYLLVLFLLSAFVLGAGMSLHGIVRTLQGSIPSLSNSKRIYATALIVCCFPVIIVPFGETLFTGVLLFYTQLMIASGIPLYTMWLKKKPWRFSLSGGILITAVIGCTVSVCIDWRIGSITCVIFSYITTRIIGLNSRNV